MTQRIFQIAFTSWVVILFLATLILVLPFYYLFSLSASVRNRRNTWRLTLLWSRLWLRFTGLSVRSYGTIPDNEATYVVVANHASYLDPIVIYDVLPFYFKPLAKHEIKKAPIFGFIYAQIAVLVDRSHIQSRAKSMQQMKTLLQEGCSIFIYPEGTFNESEEATKNFYDGAFRLAIEAQVPILPIIFPDTKTRWHPSAWWKIKPGVNRAFIMDPIAVDHLGLEDVQSLKEHVRKLISERLTAV